MSFNGNGLTIVPVELRRNRLPDGGFVTLYADITEHKRAEQALREAQAAAERANAEKSHFVAIVSHEIRTPLNTLLNAISLLADSVLTPVQRSLLATARHSGDVLLALINDILDISQMEAGKLSIRPSAFELLPLLNSLAEMLAGQAAERGINLRLGVSEGTPTVLLTDPGRLRQVLLNLLSNAVKYARTGDVWLIAEPGHEEREVIRLIVKDEGPVIPVVARSHLFRPFSRLDHIGADEAVGSGLGLSICQHLVTLMGGTIGYEPWRFQDQQSAAGSTEGNTFWVGLPASAQPHGGATTDADEPGSGAASRPNLGSGQGPAILLGSSPAIIDLPRRRLPRTRILLTEDIVANQLVTATMLRREGHLVDIATNGQAAIQAVKELPYDLVFMDIFMPGVSGQEATRIVRSLPEPAGSIPIVALTGNVEPGDEAAFKAAGMNGVLVKPVSLAELLEVVDRHVWSSRSAVAEPAADAATNGLGMSRTVPILASERITELRTNLSPATFANLVEECLLDLDHRLPALRRALVTGAPGAVMAHAHAMVGMAAGYGMSTLEARLRNIVTAAREGDVMLTGPSLAAELEGDLAEAAETLREIIRGEMV